MLECFSDTQAILFDMDGVLFLSGDCHERAFREVLQTVGMHAFSYRTIAGMRTDDAFRAILADAGRPSDEASVHRLMQNKRARAQELLKETGSVVSGSKELIRKLRGRYRLVLASSASPQTVQLFLKKSGYADAFEYVLDSSMVERSKPAPDLYQLAVQKLGLRPKQCVVIEDAVRGAEAAVRAGVPVIVLADAAHEAEFRDLVPVTIVPNLQDVQDLLV